MQSQMEEADPAERRRARVVHYVGVAVCVLLLIAAAAGILGTGPLSKAQSSTPDQKLRVEYKRFLHYQAPAELNLHVSADATSAGQFDLQVSRTFVEAVNMERIEPEPESVAAGPDYFTYVIRAETNQPVEVSFHFKARHFGKRAYQVRLGDGPATHLRHLAFP